MSFRAGIAAGFIAAAWAAPRAPVSQISDGQVQAGTATSAAQLITQINNGQIQAPGATAVSGSLSRPYGTERYAFEPEATVTNFPYGAYSYPQVPTFDAKALSLRCQ
jgi:hypothetical protein